MAIVRNTRSWRAVRKVGIRPGKYVVNSYGSVARVRSDGTLGILRERQCRVSGYSLVSLRGVTGKHKPVRVARIVANTYLGMPWDARIATHHKNRDISDNSVHNLAFMLLGNHTRMHLGHKVVAKIGSRIVYRAESERQLATKIGCSFSLVRMAHIGKIRRAKGFTVHTA